MKSMFKNILAAFCLFIATTTHAQDPFPALAPIYKDDVIPRVDITLPEDSLAIILAPGNELSDYHFHATFVFDNGIIRDTLEDIGFRLRGNTSRFSSKKSFKVSLNTYVPGRKWYGVEKINLNGEHNDPTVSRSKISWDLLRSIGIPAPRANHVELYINGRYYGLYANIEHIDEEFVQMRFGSNDGNLYKCLYPADLNYLGSDPDLYKLTSGSRRVYELETNEEEDDYSDLAYFIDVLNNTPLQDLQCELEQVLNVNSLLKSIAFDVLAGNWDGPHYNKNNFYLYHNLATGLFEYIPYDLDNTFGIDWFGIDWATRDIYNWGHQGEDRPLYWRVLAVPEYKRRFSYYIKNITNAAYREAALFPRIDALRSLLAPSIADDEYYTLTYGFDIDDFNAGFGQTLPYFHTPVGIKPFIATRRSATINQLQLEDILPVINDVTPYHGSNNVITAFIEDDQGIDFVDVHIQFGESGSLEVLAMYDDGEHMDGQDGDGLYGLVLPVIDTCVTITYVISAHDQNGNISQYPACGSKILAVCNPSVTLVVNEFMADNETTIVDDHDDYEDWVEIYNYGSEALYLGDFYLSDKEDNPTKWQFPDASIGAGAYMIIWADEESDEGPLHADIKLSAGGEFVGLFDSDANNNVLIDGLDFGEQVADVSYGRLPNGTGPYISMQPTPGSMNIGSSSTLDEKLRFEYLIYPNPTNDIFSVKSDSAVSDPQSIVLMNLFGQTVMEKGWVDEMQFDIKELPGGIYVVGLRTESGLHVVAKVIKY